MAESGIEPRCPESQSGTLSTRVQHYRLVLPADSLGKARIDFSGSDTLVSEGKMETYVMNRDQLTHH